MRQFLRRIGAAGILIVAGAAGASGASAGSEAVRPPDQYSSAVLYNLGNAFARQGNAAMAVLYYERARVLSPRDPDIEANLARVRASAGLPQEDSPWLERHARLANPNMLYWMAPLGLALALTGALMIRFRQPRLAGWLALTLGVPMLAIAAVDAAATWPLTHEAVVLRAATARVSPVDGSSPLFTVPAGLVVVLSDDYAGFALVKMPSGQAGWVARSDLARVI